MKASVFLTLSLLSFGTLRGSAQGTAQQQTRFLRASLLHESLSFDTPNGRLQVPALFEKFTIEGFQRLPELDFPFEGLLLVQLRAGEMTTVIDNERVERTVGEFWMVPPGRKMGVQTEDDKVILATYLIGERYLEAAPDKRLVSRYLRQDQRFSESAGNLFYRESYRIGDPESPVATVLDFNVGPGRITEAYSFTGPAMLQVTSGRASLIIDDRETVTDLGASLGVSDGQTVVIDNRRANSAFKFRALVWHK